jgi:hypothetical protein
MVILKATSFLEGHKRDMGMACSITHFYNTRILLKTKKKTIL